jgi:hypothetical protein
MPITQDKITCVILFAHRKDFLNKKTPQQTSKIRKEIKKKRGVMQ